MNEFNRLSFEILINLLNNMDKSVIEKLEEGKILYSEFKQSNIAYKLTENDEFLDAKEVSTMLINDDLIKIDVLNLVKYRLEKGLI